MSFGNAVTVVGNLTRDPEQRYTTSGAAVCEFGVAWNRRYDRGGEQVEEVSYFDVTCWASLAENVAATLRKGDRVVVTGRLEQQSWQSKDGENRSKVKVTADDVGPSLRWATCEITRNERDSGGARQASKPPADRNYDEEPF